MNLCFISGFSQPSTILAKLGNSLRTECNKTYISSTELAYSGDYIEKLHQSLTDKNDLVLIGWSLGGSIALEYAAKYEIKALIIISGTACYIKSENNISGIESARLEALLKGVKETKETSLRRFISSLCHPRESVLEFENCFNNAMSIESGRLIDNLEYFKKDYRECCKKIKCPALLLHDIDDRVVPISQAELLGGLLEKSKKYYTSGFGHLVIQRQPEVIAREIEKFINE